MLSLSNHVSGRASRSRPASVTVGTSANTDTSEPGWAPKTTIWRATRRARSRSGVRKMG